MRHQLIARLLSEYRTDDDLKILDIGSGQGDLCVRLHRDFKNAALVGFELSVRGVEDSRQKVGEARFHVVDVFNPPQEAQQYLGWANHATCSEVLEHVDSPEEFLRSARSYMAENGLLIVTVPGGPMSAFDRHIGHRQHFTRASLTKVLKNGGFSVERVDRAGFPFFNLYRLVVIMRGKKLVNDVDRSDGVGLVTRAADLAMAFFKFLFRFNMLDSKFGWQMIAVARKHGS